MNFKIKKYKFIKQGSKLALLKSKTKTKKKKKRAILSKLSNRMGANKKKSKSRVEPKPEPETALDLPRDLEEHSPAYKLFHTPHRFA